MSKKILFTGGAGYIGSHVLHLFLEKGMKPEDVVVVDNLSSGNKKAVPADCTFCKVDVTDKNDLEKVFREHEIDFVLHFAGVIHVEESMNDPGKYFLINSFGGLNVLDLMSTYDVSKIIFSSTASVYGNPRALPLEENHPKDPTNVYAESKLFFERMLKWFDRTYGIKHVIFRYFNACGVEKTLGNYYHQPCAHLIPNLALNLLGEKKEFHLFGTDYPTRDGTCVRDYVDIRDLAEAHYLGFKYLNDHNKSEIFNLGTGRGHTVKEIVDLTQKITGRDVNLVNKDRRQGDPSELVCENKKAREILGWSPKVDIETSIASHWRWFKDRYG